MDEIKLDYQEIPFDPTAPTLPIEQITNFLPVVAAVPSSKPRTFAESIVLHSDKAQIDYYDPKNGQFRSVGAGAYGGHFNGSGTFQLPTGWSGSISGAQVVTITHNLGTAAYAIVATPIGANLPVVLLTRNANTFTIEFDNASGTAFAAEFCFVLQLIV